MGQSQVTAGGSESLMGLCIFTMCLAEAPIFHYTESLFAIIPVPTVLHIVLGVYVLRLLLYAGRPFKGLPNPESKPAAL